MTNKKLKELLQEARAWLAHSDCPEWLRYGDNEERVYRETVLSRIDAALTEKRLCEVCPTFEESMEEFDRTCNSGCPDCGHSYGNLPYCQGNKHGKEREYPEYEDWDEKDTMR